MNDIFIENRLFYIYYILIMASPHPNPTRSSPTQTYTFFSLIRKLFSKKKLIKYEQENWNKTKQRRK